VQNWRLLINDARQASAMQERGRRHAADAAADDCHTGCTRERGNHRDASILSAGLIATALEAR
jgi:hypothetical protein